MNGEYIKAMDFDTYYQMAKPYIDEAVRSDVDKMTLAQWVKTRIEVFPDIPALIDFVDELPDYDIEMYTHKKMKTNAETSLQVLKEVLPILEFENDYSNDNLYSLLLKFIEEKEYKNGFVLWPIRTAVSGKQMTPAGATELMELFGKDETIKRIKAGISKLEQS